MKDEDLLSYFVQVKSSLVCAIANFKRCSKVAKFSIFSANFTTITEVWKFLVQSSNNTLTCHLECTHCSLSSIVCYAGVVCAFGNDLNIVGK